MNRSFLWGLALGATLVLGTTAIASVWMKDRPDPLYLRIADDNYDYLLGPDHKAEDGPTSARLIRRCGINKFTIDLPMLDHSGSAFVDLESTPRPKLNCLIGEARIHSLSLAIMDGENVASFECLPGWPSRFRRFDPGDYQFCPDGRPNRDLGKATAPQ